MPLTRPYPIDKAWPNALDLRKQASAVYPREGLFPDPITAANAGVAYGNGGWNVAARPFVANVRRGTAAFSQSYGCAQITNDSAATAWTIAAAPGSGSRIDILWIRAVDPSQSEALTTPGSETVPRAVPIFGVTAGVASGSPVAPALPSGVLEVARVTTPSGAASIAGSTIVQTYTFAHVLGSDLYARNEGALPALAYKGEYARTIDNNWRWRYSGTAWVPIETEWVAIGSGGSYAGAFAVNWSGPAASPHPVASVKRDGDEGRLAGGVFKGAAWAAGESLFTLPPHLWPSVYQEVLARVAGSFVFLAINTNGVVQTTSANGAAGTIVSLNTSWAID